MKIPTDGQEPTKAMPTQFVKMAKIPLGIKEPGKNQMIKYVYSEVLDCCYYDNFEKRLTRLLKLLEHIADSEFYILDEPNVVAICGETIDVPKRINKEFIMSLVPLLNKANKEIIERRKKIIEEEINLLKFYFGNLLSIDNKLYETESLSSKELKMIKKRIIDIKQSLQWMSHTNIVIEYNNKKWSLEKILEFAKDLLKSVEEKNNDLISN